jgi:polysaccharide biosynthesis protein PslH
LRDGEVIAIHQLTRGFYEAGHKVTVAAINTKKHFFPPDEMPAENQELADFHSVEMDTDFNFWDALKSMVAGDSYNIQRFISPDFERLLAKILKENQYDIVQLEGLYLLPYLLVIRKYSQATVVMRAHNIEHLIWERNSKRVKPGAKKWYMQNLAQRMKEYEIYHLNSCDALLPISTLDAKKFEDLGCKLPIHVTPIGVNNLNETDDVKSESSHSVGYIGSMDWFPNREGLQWFLDNVWEKVLAAFPDATFFMAGRNFSDDFPAREYPRVERVGEVENARTFLNSNQIVVVPLFSGSGMRVKIIEALSLGKPVISTTIGAEGIEVANGENILIADSADGFVRHIKTCFMNPEFSRRLGSAAKKLVQDKYNIHTIVNDLLHFYQSLRQ